MHEIIPECPQSSLYLCGVADRSFVDNHLRNPALKLATPIRPPFLGDLLVAGDNQVTAGTSDQIANKCCFQVYRFHAGSIAASTHRTACMPAARQAKRAASCVPFLCRLRV